MATTPLLLKNLGRQPEQQASRPRRRAATVILASVFVLAVGSPSVHAAQPRLRPPSVATTEGTTLTLARPAHLAPGDVMVAVVAARTATGAISPPPGWMLIRRDMSGNVGAALTQALYVRVSRADEPLQYSWSFASTVSANGAILAYGGISKRRPVDGHSGRYTPDARSFRAPSVRTGRRADLVLGFFSSTGTQGITPPTGMAERFDVAGAGLRLEAASYVMRAAGRTGAKRAADSANEVNRSNFGQLLALRSVCPATSGPPRAAERPKILGPAYLGETAKAFSGTWCGKQPMRFAYRWQRCGPRACTSIKGATGTSYTPTRKDVDRSLTFIVRARSSAGTTTATSSPKQVGRGRPKNTSPPVISGTAQEGFELIASTGSWAGPDPMSYAYQWKRCDSAGSNCAGVPGATRPSYVLASSEVGATMRVVVTATNSSGSRSATSVETAVVTPASGLPTAPANDSRPSVSGSATQEATLTASPGSWSGTTPIAYGYQWERCDSGGAPCTAVSAATGETYTVRAADVGSSVRVVVTASNSVGSASAASAPTAVVVASPSPPVNGTLPSISGTAEVGSILTASAGTWTGTTPIGYSYQWRRCDQAGTNCYFISGATSASYTVASADGGSTLRVLVTAANEFGSNVATSTQTAVVPSVYPASYFSGPAGANNILPPTARGAFLGLWEPGLTYAYDRENVFGRKLDLMGSMYKAPLGGCYSSTPPFSNGTPLKIVQHGSIPIVHYKPGFTLDEINAGKADDCFRDLGRRIRDFGYPFFLRMYHEFNGDWMLYSGCGDSFINAWRRTVSLIRGAGGTNAIWVWNPAEKARDCAFQSYPGDAWVDWVAVDGYNRGTGWASSKTQCWCEFWQLFRDDPSVSLHDVYGPRKPFAVFETGSLEDASEPGRKGNWHVNALASIKQDFPYLKALVYTDLDLSSNGGPDWRLDTSQSSLDGFTTLARDSYFNTR